MDLLAVTGLRTAAFLEETTAPLGVGNVTPAGALPCASPAFLALNLTGAVDAALNVFCFAGALFFTGALFFVGALFFAVVGGAYFFCAPYTVFSAGALALIGFTLLSAISSNAAPWVAVAFAAFVAARAAEGSDISNTAAPMRAIFLTPSTTGLQFGKGAIR